MHAHKIHVHMYTKLYIYICGSESMHTRIYIYTQVYMQIYRYAPKQPRTYAWTYMHRHASFKKCIGAVIRPFLESV